MRGIPHDQGSRRPLSGRDRGPRPRDRPRRAVPQHLTATAPRWEKFLRELWPEDPESVAALQEWFGLLLTDEMKYQKILAIVGPRRSGKGTIGRILGAVIGPENVTGPTLAGLTSTFGLQGLIGKRCGLISDARLSGRVDQAIVTERLLSISGEDAVSVPRKYATDWNGRLSASERGWRWVATTSWGSR